MSQMRMVLSTEQEANTVPSTGLHWMSSTESSCPCHTMIQIQIQIRFPIPNSRAVSKPVLCPAVPLLHTQTLPEPDSPQSMWISSRLISQQSTGGPNVNRICSGCMYLCCLTRLRHNPLLPCSWPCSSSAQGCRKPLSRSSETGAFRSHSTQQEQCHPSPICCAHFSEGHLNFLKKYSNQCQWVMQS